MSASLARRIEALERSTRVGVQVIDPTGLAEWHRGMWPPWRVSASGVGEGASGVETDCPSEGLVQNNE